MAKSDEKIREDVIAQLDWDDRVDSSGIDVNVSDRVVTLSGTVPNLYARSWALAVVWGVPDVADVRNELEVQHAEPVSSEREAEIRAAVVGALSNSSMLDNCDLRVSLHGGVLTLEGTTDKYWKRSYAEQIASSFRGVSEIESKIAICPSEERTDQQIADAVLAALDRSASFNTDEIDVTVKDGVVSLAGAVPSWSCREAALDAAHHTSGVRDVHSELRLPGT